MDVLPYVESDPAPEFPAHYSPALAQLSQLSKLSQQRSPVVTANQKLAMIRSKVNILIKNFCFFKISLLTSSSPCCQVQCIRDSHTVH